MQTTRVLFIIITFTRLHPPLYVLSMKSSQSVCKHVYKREHTYARFEPFAPSCPSVCIMRHAMRTLFVLLIISITSRLATAWWDNMCADNGQCANMIRSYEGLIKGPACRSFYFTGLCTRLCTFSLKSLISRQTWTKCADRCDWSSAVTKGAVSWLHMCMDHPAPDVADPPDNPPRPPDNNTSHISSPTSSRTLAPWYVPVRIPLFGNFFLLSVLLLLLLLAILLSISPMSRVKFRIYSRRFLAAVRSVLPFARTSRTLPGKSTLDIGPDPKGFANFQRGARRHLKSLRATLD